MDPAGSAGAAASTAIPVIALSALGPLEIRGSANSTRPGAGRQRRILTVLAVAAMESRTVSAAELLDAVYGDDATDRSRRSLSTELWRCRQLLGGDAITGEADGYSLDPLVVEVDLVLFTRLVRDGRASLDSGDPGRAERGLSQALGLWRDTPLVDWRDHPDGQAALAGLEELRLGATEDLADALIRQGRHQEAVGTLQSFTQEHPAREHVWALLIECHVGLADERRARSALDSARRTLAEQGLDLGSELGAVRDRLRATTAAAEPAARGASDTDELPSLIGRQTQLSAANSVIDTAVRTASPAAVVVAGEAGIGKTALLRQLVGPDRRVSSPGPGPTVGRVTCDRRLTLPYAALIPLLKRLEPDPNELAEMLSAGRSSPDSWIDAGQLRGRIVDLIEAATERLSGLVLVVEDAHWATPELIEVLLDLLARRSPIPLAMLVSIRDPAVTDLDLDQALSELRHRASEVIHLTGLDEAQARQFLGEGLDRETARAAHRLTGGNPLHLRNLIVRPDGELLASPTLTEAFDEHLAALPADLLPVIEVAAAIGARFDARVLTSAVAHPPMRLAPHTVVSALQTARSAGLVAMPEAEGHHLEFVHGLVRDRIHDRTPGHARTQAHALIGHALSRISLQEAPSADLLAHHSEKGWPVCPTGEVIDRLNAAGEAAAGQLGFAEAARYFRSALDFIAMDPDLDESGWLPRLLAASGQAAAAAEDLANARAAYLALHSYGERTADPAVALRGALGVVHTYATERIDNEALDRLAAALERLFAVEPSTTAEERNSIAASLSALHLYRPTVARTFLERAAVREPASRPTLTSSLWEQETVTNALALAKELVQTSDADPLGSAIRMWASEVASGQWALTDTPAGIWSLDGSHSARWEAKLWQITTAMATGQFARALRLLDAAEKEVAGVGTAIGAAGRNAQLLGQRMWIAMQCDDWTELERLAVANRPVFTARRPIMRTVGAQMQIVLGDRELAMEYCDDLVDEFLTGSIPSRELHASVVGLGNACLWLGHDRGIELCRELLRPWEGQHVLFYLVQHWGSVHYHLGKYAAYAGDLDEAIDHLAAATDEHHAVGATVLETQSRRLLASSLWHRDGPADRTEAEACHAAASRQAESLGMTGVATRAWPPVRAFDLA